jgi:hypothetical protein
MSAHALVGAALVMLGVGLAGCAATRPAPVSALATIPVAESPIILAGAAPYQLCALDALRWSHGFVPRSSTEPCVTILESVKLGNE